MPGQISITSSEVYFEVDEDHDDYKKIDSQVGTTASATKLGLGSKSLNRGANLDTLVAMLFHCTVDFHAAGLGTLQFFWSEVLSTLLQSRFFHTTPALYSSVPLCQIRIIIEIRNGPSYL